MKEQKQVKMREQEDLRKRMGEAKSKMMTIV